MMQRQTKHDWRTAEVEALFEKPFFDLMHEAHRVHLQHFNANEIQLSQLLSIKSGGCPEDCKYCPQSTYYKTGVQNEKLMDVDAVIEKAKQAKANGATRFCMGAAWRSPNERQMEAVSQMISEVKALGLETCATLGMLKQEQAHALKDAGLDYYNHNLDTSPDHYKNITTTRSYDDRFETLEHVRTAGIKVCCGGILGMGESRTDRAQFLMALANQTPHPESVPLNQLIAVENTPLENQAPIEPFEFVRTVAVARIMMPTSYVRLSAGRENMDEMMQAWCFYAGANSIFYGEKLLTCNNPSEHDDLRLLEKLNLKKDSSCTHHAKETVACEG